MSQFKDSGSSASSKAKEGNGILTIFLAIGGAFLGMGVAVAIFFGSGMANPKPPAPAPTAPVSKKTEPSKTAPVKKTDNGLANFESSFKAALTSGNSGTATRMAATKDSAWTNAFLALCHTHATDAKATTRAAVASALGVHLAAKPSDDPDFLKLMDDADPVVVKACIESLEGIKPCPVVFVRKAFAVAGKSGTSSDTQERIAAWLRTLSPISANLITLFALEADTKVAAIRPVVAEALAQITLEPKVGLPLAKKYLADSDAKTQLAGIQLVANYRKTQRAEVLEDLLTMAGSKTDDVRMAAVKELEGFKPMQAADISVLTKSMDLPAPDARAKACNLLATLKADALPALPAMVKLIKDPDSKVQSEAVAAIGMLGKDAAKEATVIRPLATSPNALVRAAAIVALARIDRDAKTIDSLFEALTDSDSTVAKSANSGIDSLSPPLGSSDMKVLEARVTHKSPVIRAKVFAVAATMGTDAKPLVSQALKALDDTDTNVMIQAGRALMAQPDQQNATLGKMQTVLMASVGTPAKEPLALATLDFMAQIGPKASPAIPNLRKLLAPGNKNKNVVLAALNVAGKMGKEGLPLLPDIFNLVVDAVNPPNDTLENYMAVYLKSGVNQGIVSAIANMGAPAVPEIAKLLERKEPGARYFGLVVLDAMGTPAMKAMPAIENLSKADTEKVMLIQLTAVAVKGRLNDPMKKAP